MRSAPIFVGSGFVAQYPEGGGSSWVPLQYVLGFRDTGAEVYWLEFLSGSGDAHRDRALIETFFARADRFGIRERAIVLYAPAGRDAETGEFIGSPAGRALAAAIRDGVLLNLSNSIPRQFRDEFACTVLYDIDPGMVQLWAQQWDMGVGNHDLYITIGQSIGTPACAVPTCGVTWHTVWPAVYLPAWPKQERPGERYTTITQWWNGNKGYDLIDGELYEHNKRTSFLEVLDLPRHVGLELELAANITAGEIEDREALERHGWRLVQPHEVAGTPWTYRDYIQHSRGEFSCAKPSVVKASPGWISDRTICYLASGRPCVVQAAGADRHVPENLGLQFFSAREEAVEALIRIEREYPRACIEARALAEELFSTRVVIPQILGVIGLTSRPAPSPSPGLLPAEPDAGAQPLRR